MDRQRIHVLIPAHDEEASIAATLNTATGAPRDQEVFVQRS